MKLFTILFMIHNVEFYFIQNQSVQIVNTECSNFGTINIVTNEHNYEQALAVRKDNKKCGEDALFFKKNYFKLTVPYYFFIENSLLISLPFIIISPSILLFMMH